MARKTKKSPSDTVKKEKENVNKAKFEEWYGIEYDKKLEHGTKDESDSSSFSDSSDEEENADPEELSSNAKMFFDNPVFKSLEQEKSSSFEREIENISEESSDEEDEMSALRPAKKRKRKRDEKDKKEKKSENEIEIVPLEKDISEDDGKLVLTYNSRRLCN